MGKRFLALLLLLLAWAISPLSAQAVRDYAITDIRYELVEDNTILKIVVIVENRGTDASQATEVLVTNISDDAKPTVLIQDSLEPLAENASVTLEIPFPVTNFPAGTEQTIEVSIGLDEFEIANTSIAEDNVRTVVVPIPNWTPIISTPIIFELKGEEVIILGETYSRNNVILALLAAVGILLLLWLLTVIIRLIFRRPPRFATWQPPYGLIPMYDPNTLEGRRWAWQQHAQNSLLLAPPTEGNIHPIKLLMGADGRSLTTWRISGMRLSQYDSYGRIARSQLIADKKLVRRLNGVLKKRHNMNEPKLQKSLRPIATELAKAFSKNISEKNAFLPVTFDIRWEGKHGEVRIFFELYQCVQNAWYRIDQWEPMMQVLSQTMQENFTFTIHGKASAEKMREYRERLRDDLIWLLMETFRVEQAQAYNPQEQQAARQQFEIPDTLSGAPIPETNQALPSSASG